MPGESEGKCGKIERENHRGREGQSECRMDAEDGRQQRRKIKERGGKGKVKMIDTDRERERKRALECFPRMNH